MERELCVLNKLLCFTHLLNGTTDAWPSRSSGRPAFDSMQIKMSSGALVMSDLFALHWRRKKYCVREKLENQISQRGSCKIQMKGKWVWSPQEISNAGHLWISTMKSEPTKAEIWHQKRTSTQHYSSISQPVPHIPPVVYKVVWLWCDNVPAHVYMWQCTCRPDGGGLLRAKCRHIVDHIWPMGQHLDTSALVYRRFPLRFLKNVENHSLKRDLFSNVGG